MELIWCRRSVFTMINPSASPTDKGTERGASMIEYALLVTLIALVAFIAVSFAGDELSGTYSMIGDTLQQVNPGA